MCINRKEIVTLSGRKMYVNCGHCPACLQQAANKRTFLIRNNEKVGYTTLFITLTYDNKFIPYIKKSDFEIYDNVLPIYRDFDVRNVRNSYPALACDIKSKKRVKGNSVCYYSNRLYSCGCIDYLPNYFEDVKFLPCLRYKSKSGFSYHEDKVSVLCFSDFQNFIKRLRINYERKFKCKASFSFFGVGEYGPETKRAHFHVCLSVPTKEIDNYIEAVVKSWSYCSTDRLRKYIEIAKDCSSYVSSYVNSYTFLSDFYRQKVISPKCSHSKHYGFNSSDFTLSKIKECIDKRDFSFSYSILTKSKAISVERLVPSYVIAYWFPKIKGFSKLSFDELIEVYSHPSRLAFYSKKLEYRSINRVALYDEFGLHRTGSTPYTLFSRVHSLFYNFEDIDEFFENEDKYYKYSDFHINYRIIKSARDRFVSSRLFFTDDLIDFEDDFYLKHYYKYMQNREKERLGIEFALYVYNAWLVYNSNLLKFSYTIPEKCRYENIYLINDKVFRKRHMPTFSDDVNYEIDVNNDNSFNFYVNNYYIDKFLAKDKSKKIYNMCYSNLSVNF